MAYTDEAELALRGVRSGGPVPGARTIPVGEATELTGQGARSAFRAATGAPATPVGGSADAEAFRAQQATRIGPTQPGAQIEGIGTRAANAGRQLAAAAEPVVSGARTAVNGTAGKLVGGLAAGQAIVDGMDANSTDRYAARFGVDKPTGDGSFGDVAKFIALRAGGFASDLGNNLTGGLAGRLYADQQPGSGVRATAAPPAIPPATPAAAAPSAAAAAPTPPNVVARNGNTFSGEGVRDGFTYAGDGAPKGARGAGVTVIPAANFASVTPSLAAELASKREEAAARGVPMNPDGSLRASQSFGDGGITTGNQVGGFNTGRAGVFDPERGARDLDQYTPSQLQFLSNQESNATQRRSQDMQAEQSRYNTDTQASVSLRSQDMTARTAANTARIQQMEKDRQYQLDVVKEGRAAAEQNFNQREAADKNLTARLESLFPGQDGKPDAAAVANAKQGISRAVARLGGSIDKLTTSDQEQLLAASHLLAKVQQNAGILPWKPDMLKTIDPLDLTGLRVLKNGDRQITRADSKAAGQIIPARFFETEEANRILPGTPTNRYDMLSERGTR